MFSFKFQLTLSGGCPLPKAPGYGSISGSKLFYCPGESVRYNCSYGYEMRGNTKSTCQYNYLWDNKPPTCISKSIWYCFVVARFIQIRMVDSHRRRNEEMFSVTRNVWKLSHLFANDSQKKFMTKVEYLSYW